MGVTHSAAPTTPIPFALAGPAMALPASNSGACVPLFSSGTFPPFFLSTFRCSAGLSSCHPFSFTPHWPGRYCSVQTAGPTASVTEAGTGAGAEDVCVANTVALSGVDCSSLRSRPFRGLGAANALDHTFLSFADYFGPSLSDTRLASLVARAGTDWSDARLHNQVMKGLLLG